MEGSGQSTHPEIVLFGLKATYAVAGFCGSVITLSFLRPLSGVSAISAVLTGVCTALYLTPITANYLGVSAEDVRYGIAFLLGLTSMNIIPGLLLLSEQVKENPGGFLQKVLPKGEKK